MNQRVSKVKHPAGFELITPLLVPSFSSKGFALNENGQSELCSVIDFTKEFIHESQLVSAYDIYYKHIPPLESINKTQITFVDSGGYETSNNYDLSETRKYERSKNDWNRELFAQSVSGLGKVIPTVLVSFDHVNEKQPLEDQIRDARSLFQSTPHCLSDFLIKPQSEHLTIQIQDVIKIVGELSTFGIIGLTEKELGESMSMRLKNIFNLRRSLDAKGIKSPIHIFGALDPISVIHYFLAGAEIFDGLSWLKYSYKLGCATYINNSAILDSGAIQKTDNDLRLETIKSNLYLLERLKSILTEFTSSSDFDLFDSIGWKGLGTIIKANIDSLKN